MTRGKRGARGSRKKREKWTPFTPGRVMDKTGDPRIDTKEAWVNNRFQVFVYRPEFPGIPTPMVHLSIKTHERSVMRDWRDLQRIKNELCGTSCEGVELFPSEDRIADMANQYHMWVLPPGYRFPFGFDDGRMISSEPIAKRKCEQLKERSGLSKVPDNSRQRPIASHHTTKGLPEVGPVWEGFVNVKEKGE